MEALINDAASRLKHVTFNSQVLEIHQHLSMCRRRGRALRGRDRTLDAVRVRLQGSAARSHLPPRPVVLHGKDGCGKTSVIAKVGSPEHLSHHQESADTTPVAGSFLHPLRGVITPQLSYNTPGIRLLILPNSSQ